MPYLHVLFIQGITVLYHFSPWCFGSFCVFFLFFPLIIHVLQKCHELVVLTLFYFIELAEHLWDMIASIIRIQNTPLQSLGNSVPSPSWTPGSFSSYRCLRFLSLRFLYLESRSMCVCGSSMILLCFFLFELNIYSSWSYRYIHMNLRIIYKNTCICVDT